MEPLKPRLGWGEVEHAIYASVESRSRIDYYLVSKKLEDRGLVKAAGVLADPVNESNHKPVMLDTDADTTLEKPKLWDGVQQAQKERDMINSNATLKVVHWGKVHVGRVEAYQEAVEGGWPKGGQLCGMITGYCNIVSEIGSRVWEDEAVEVGVVAQMGQLMAKAPGAMLAGQEEVYKKLRVVGRRGTGGQRKHQSSPLYMKLAHEMRMAVRMADS